MRSALPLLLLATSLAAQQDFAKLTAELEHRPGLFDLYIDQDQAKVYLAVAGLDRDFLYLDSLPHGLGSNDIGLDRGKLGRTRLCHFERVGKQLLLKQRNLKHRANSQSATERRAVRQAFAAATLWSFAIAAESEGRVLVDATDFLLRDVYGVARSLQSSQQGSYKLDGKRSHPVLAECKAFPANTELTASLCFHGPGRGRHVRPVAADPQNLELRQRLSFVALPGPGYQPRAARVEAGFFTTGFVDYAVPLGQPMRQSFINRHRLEHKGDGSGEVKEPIVYHLDPGTPEPVRSALLDGARWWTQAFDAAGFPGGFQVEMLPDGADPMDVRYNVIQWVHRSSRGWSYGNSIVDPRTGEIIKGHVSLGSRRVRQDYLIAQALIGPDHERCQAMALARLRQLSAHEVGHTIGLAHNFAASTMGDASVMDYPHPNIQLGKQGFDLSKAYGVGVGAWDILAVRWGYSTADAKTRDGWLREARRKGLHFLSDSDARSRSSLHPGAHLWDNGADAVAAMRHIMAVRRRALNQLGPGHLFPHQDKAHLDELLTPVYLMHRYQLDAVAKLIGGVSYDRHGNPLQPVPAARQRDALRLLARCLGPDELQIPPALLAQIPPRTHGSRRSRELLPSRSGAAVDPMAAADSLCAQVLDMLLDPARLERVLQQRGSAGLREITQVFVLPGNVAAGNPLWDTVQLRIAEHLLQTWKSPGISPTLRQYLRDEMWWLRSQRTGALGIRLAQGLEHPERIQPRPAEDLPPGSPIGCGCEHHHGRR